MCVLWIWFFSCGRFFLFFFNWMNDLSLVSVEAGQNELDYTKYELFPVFPGRVAKRQRLLADRCEVFRRDISGWWFMDGTGVSLWVCCWCCHCGCMRTTMSARYRQEKGILKFNLRAVDIHVSQTVYNIIYEACLSRTLGSDRLPCTN